MGEKEARKIKIGVSPKEHKSRFIMTACETHVSARVKFAARMNETL